jgi:hypothetical protein
MINIVCSSTAAENLRVNGKAYLCCATTKIVDPMENFSNSDATGNDINRQFFLVKYHAIAQINCRHQYFVIFLVIEIISEESLS